MSELEMAIEALKRCVPAEEFKKALSEVAGAVQPKPVPKLDLAERIHSILNELGTPAHLKGYRYTVYAIEQAVKDADMVECMTKRLYPAVAEKFGTTPSRAERAIRHAIETTWDRGDLDVIYSYFGNTIQKKKGKPTNSEFIAMLANRIRLEAGNDNV